jgi:hypothetical protein
LKHYTTKDIIIKADEVSAEVYNLNEGVLENRVDNCDVKVKAEPDKFEDEEFKEALEDKVEYFPYTLHLQTPRQAQF